MKLIHFLTLIILTSLLSCKEERKFPEVKNLSEYKQSEFLPTLEHKLPENKNSIYCVTLLYAWDEIRKIINSPLHIDDSLNDLTLLNNSKSYAGVLKQDEYSASGEVNGDLITARAEFKKSLPFEIKLSRFTNELLFDKIKVASFGIFGMEEENTKTIEILYYHDDNNFIIKLLPKDKEHEIILNKSETKFKTMAEMIADIQKKIKIGKAEKQNEKLGWKYYLANNDQVVIPKFTFNIETNYSTLEGNKFHSDSIEFIIETAWQRTAFILDESGAEIESESVIIADATSIEEEINPQPKIMKFDKPFFLMLKRTDSIQPYFGLWLTNTELMTKE